MLFLARICRAWPQGGPGPKEGAGPQRGEWVELGMIMMMLMMTYDVMSSIIC